MVARQACFSASLDSSFACRSVQPRQQQESLHREKLSSSRNELYCPHTRKAFKHKLQCRSCFCLRTRLVRVHKGMVWREVLEFRDNIPARRHKPSRKNALNGDGKAKGQSARLSIRGSGKHNNRMVSAFTRYCCPFLLLLGVCCCGLS